MTARVGGRAVGTARADADASAGGPDAPRSVEIVDVVETPDVAQVAQVAQAIDAEIADVVVLPDAVVEAPAPPIERPHTAESPAQRLTREFADVLPAEAIERVVAAARHALERFGLPATPEAIERLARDRLLSRLTLLTTPPHTAGGISVRPKH